MKRTLILIAAAAVAAARAETPPSYTLAIPGAPVIRDTADALQNAWLASNCVASVSASFGGGGVSLAETPGLDKYTLASSEAGFGVERIAMLKYELDDIRLLYENDIRFIEQFK